MKRALLIGSLLSLAAFAQAGMPQQPGTPPQPGTTTPPQPNPNTLSPNPPGVPPNTVMPAPVVNPTPVPTMKTDGGVR